MLGVNRNAVLSVDNGRSRTMSKFLFADDRITRKEVLDKSIEVMGEADFGLFDITDWNPNVSLELGVAIGKDYSRYLLWNPAAEHEQPPS
jgi:hypothetical protein